MKFQGFDSIAQYESECARPGYHTERVPFHKGGDESGAAFFVLYTGSPVPSSDAVTQWNLFPADESAELLSGIVSNQKMARAFVGGVDVNHLGTLAAHGYFPMSLT